MLVSAWPPNQQATSSCTVLWPVCNSTLTKVEEDRALLQHCHALLTFTRQDIAYFKTWTPKISCSLFFYLHVFCPVNTPSSSGCLCLVPIWSHLRCQSNLLHLPALRPGCPECYHLATFWEFVGISHKTVCMCVSQKHHHIQFVAIIVFVCYPITRCRGYLNLND